MTENLQELYDQRLGRFLGTIALEPVDRVPICTGTNYFAMVQSGYNYQQIMYDPEIWYQVELDFCHKYPEIDSIRTNLFWAPTWDVVSNRRWRMPGTSIPATGFHQFNEMEYMKADEYRMLIDDPIGFRMERLLPRALGELEERGSTRAYMALLKAVMAENVFIRNWADRAARLKANVGMPIPTAGMFLAPFDKLADEYRGLQGITMDLFRQPDNVLEACEAVLPDLVHFALMTADPLRQRPIFLPTHKACFLSPKQFDKFYWPSLKKSLMMLIEAGYAVRILVEGNCDLHMHHFAELPKGSLLLDIDNEGDIFKAREVIGNQQCLGGGIPDSMLILGTPDEVRARVKLLCETVGKDGGWVVNGGAGIPGSTKPENWRALLDAVHQYGKYSDSPPPKPKSRPKPAGPIQGLPEPRVVTPWEVKKAELGEITGDEDLIRRPWEMFEKMAYLWMVNW